MRAVWIAALTAVTMSHGAATAAEPVLLHAAGSLRSALVRPGLTVTPATLLERMLDPAIKVGTALRRRA